jgi:archaellum component FlaC
MGLRPGDVVRKIQQHDNDILSIYELLGDIHTTQTQHTSQFETIDTHLKGVDTHLETIDTHLKGVDTHLASLAQKLDTVIERLPQ